MSISLIPTNFLDRTVNIERSTKTMSAQGSPVSSWSDIVSSVACTLQPISMKELKELSQGKEFLVTDKAYLTHTASLTILPGDRLVDNLESITYNIISVRRYKSARTAVSTGHHYKLLLENPRATRS